MTYRPDPRVLFMGMGGPLSIEPLRVLLNARVSVGAVVSPGTASWPPTAQTGASGRLPDLLHLAAGAGLPVEAVSWLEDPQTVARLAAYHPDIILVSCFPFVLPAAVLHLPPGGCFNLHPSLLPAYRGPAPLFWQLRLAEPHTGVTIHRMTDRVDAGEIISQTAVPLADGMSGLEADRLLGRAGGRLMRDMLVQWTAGDPAGRTQEDAASTYFPWPTTQDFALDTGWPARRAYNFISGTAEWGCTYPVELGGEPFVVWEAPSYSPDQVLGRPFMLIGQELWIQFSPGVLRARGGPSR